jgi:beta-lactamase superfamily II metal-dependent hydrolase
MMQIELLPAAHGDAIWIEYGSSSQVHRLLIDGGPAHAYQAGLRRCIEKLDKGDRTFELMVVTHIDADHIDGALILLQELQQLNIHIAEFWFNGWNQLPQQQDTRDVLAPLQGEFLGGLIDASLKGVWNKRFDNQRVVVLEDEKLPEVELKGGAKLTLLGPSEPALRRLRARWSSAIRDFSPGDVNEALRRLRERREYRPPPPPAVFAAPQYGDDRAVANGSSISFVLEYEGVSLLLTGDAHARSLAASLERLAKQRLATKLRFDAVKLPHHGSMSNISEAWLQWVDCERWLISTNGAVFDHPDVATAQLLADHYQRPTLFCNYRSPSTERLETQADSAKWRTAFPEEGKSKGEGGGLLLRLSAPTSNDSRAGQPSGAQRQRGQKPTQPGEGKSKARTRRARPNASGKTGRPKQTGGTR